MNINCECCSSKVRLGEGCKQVTQKIFEILIKKMGWMKTNTGWKCQFCNWGM